jgi:hypothetical protein
MFLILMILVALPWWSLQGRYCIAPRKPPVVDLGQNLNDHKSYVVLTEGAVFGRAGVCIATQAEAQGVNSNHG